MFVASNLINDSEQFQLQMLKMILVVTLHYIMT